ncbi:hypothetical protein JAAARDRAFT_146261 [Jaapia argillacea MUCL 33604]|uniref:DUF6741 domain-containing protein n=1 Tax=Jaapia argillacea MUCL 33604 TaxID=933084 RepID=A0A067QD49_9AGAM|nr:hypothetical protein JAAARDRAFT_146261 [Jaapia argillacea MUCL 33604]
MSYPAYDNFSRRPSLGTHSSYTPFPYDGQAPPLSRSRRQSLSYGVPAPGQQVGYPYDEPGRVRFDEPLPSTPYDREFATPGYATPAPSHQYPASYHDDTALGGYQQWPEQRHMSAPSYTPRTDSYFNLPPATPRTRRSSTASHFSRVPILDNFRRMNSKVIKFKRKNSFRSGVTLYEATSNVRLSGADNYSFYDLNADHRRQFWLKVKWQNYPSVMYKVPVQQAYDDRVDLQSVARRVARACTHYFQSNAIPASMDRILLVQLEESSPGVWLPVLTTCHP